MLEDPKASPPVEQVEPYDFKNLPAHACFYCGIHAPEAVVKCNIKDCGKWFCNGKGTSSYGSHILMHLVTSKHKEICLHPESPFKDTEFECYNCSCRNIFQLGIVAHKTEQMIILLCRDVCRISIKDEDWDLENWNPLIENKAILQWLVRPPTENEFKKSRKMMHGEMKKLEEIWKTKPKATFEDMATQEEDQPQAPVLLRYRDPEQYKEVFEPLIKLEADYDKQFKESHKQTGIKVKWDFSASKKRLAIFMFPKEDHIKMIPGDELRIIHKADGIEKLKMKGNIIKIGVNDEIYLEIKGNFKVPTDPEIRYTIEFVWKSTAYDRMKTALRVFLKDEQSMSHYIFYKLLGYNVQEQFLKSYIPKNLSVPGLPDLNHFQLNAVKKALITPLCLIQGPPGTGKTVTSTTIVYQLAKQKMGQVLVCAPSNIAVDQLTERITLTGLKVVRLCARSRESISSNIDHLTLHELVDKLDKGPYARMQDLMRKKEQEGFLMEKDENQLKKLKRDGENEILKSADVICTTCVAGFDRRLKGFNFKQVLIDEATQATEPEALMPMLKGCKHIILVGDHCQLGPVILCRKASKAGMNQSLFERLVCLGIRPIRLQVQYRMHPSLSHFPSFTFYEGSLQNGISIQDRLMKEFEFKWPVPAHPMVFYHSISSEEISSSGTSFLNRIEAKNVEEVVTTFLRGGLNPDQIGIITPYEGQRTFLTSYMKRNGPLATDLYESIEVTSVDGFQGREKDYILLSCVRSNDAGDIGFLTDPRRLNVALTRAKYGMIIFGNAKVLQKYDLWNNLLNVYKKQGCLLEGQSIDSLRQCGIILRESVKYNADKKAFMLTEANLSNLDKNKQKKSGVSRIDSDFDTLSEASKTESQISYGSRVSAYGFTDMFGLSKTSPNTFADKEVIQAPQTNMGALKKTKQAAENTQGSRLQADDDLTGDLLGSMGMK